MRLLAGMSGSSLVFGLRSGERVVDLSDEFDTPSALVAASMDPPRLEPLVASSPTLDLNELVALPPVPEPGKIVCVGTNYADHVAESDSVVEAPDHPMLFVRFSGSLVGHGANIERPSASTSFDFEGELAVVIGRTIRNADRDEAMAAIAGYAPFMDGTLRDFQRHTSQFTPGKNFDRSGAWGPEIVTADEIADPTELTLTTTVNGEVMQSASTRQLIHPIDRIVSYISSFTTLHPGDVIATGTPGGVGYARTPPRWLTPGDRVEVAISEVGILSNEVVDADE